MNTSISIPKKSNIKVPSGNILVNKKWRGSQVAAELGAATRTNILYSDSMGFVDFFPSDLSPVIYVTEAEMLTGVSYNERIHLLDKEYKNKGLIIADFTCTPEYKELQSNCIKLEIVMIPITSQAEIPLLLTSLSYVDSRLPTNPFKSSPQHAERNMEKEQVALLKGIPNVGEKCALKLLKSYGHVKAIAEMSQDRLASKVGQPQANVIHRYFRDKVYL